MREGAGVDGRCVGVGVGEARATRDGRDGDGRTERRQDGETETEGRAGAAVAWRGGRSPAAHHRDVGTRGEPGSVEERG